MTKVLKMQKINIILMTFANNNQFENDKHNDKKLKKFKRDFAVFYFIIFIIFSFGKVVHSYKIVHFFQKKG